MTERKERTDRTKRTKRTERTGEKNREHGKNGKCEGRKEGRKEDCKMKQEERKEYCKISSALNKVHSSKILSLTHEPNNKGKSNADSCLVNLSKLSWIHDSWPGTRFAEKLRFYSPPQLFGEKVTHIVACSSQHQVR